MNQPPQAKTELVLPTPLERFIWRRKYWLIFLSFSIAFVAARLLAPAPVEGARPPSGVQAAHAIGIAMYLYAQDHGGKYPSGESSTEVFQQLLDGGYVTEPALFYLPKAGRSKAKSTKLQPESVIWDVSGGVSANDPDGLPLVFLTGYKIEYIPGGRAHALREQIWDGIIVFYKNNFAFYKSGYASGVPMDIPLIDPTFDPKGKSYRQLTPDGPLP